jgi:cyanophycin synthetase
MAFGLCPRTKTLLTPAASRPASVKRFKVPTPIARSPWSWPNSNSGPAPRRKGRIDADGSPKYAAIGSSLRALGVPTPVHVLVRRKQDLARAAELIGWPCVVKPTRGGRSIGVTMQITNLAQLSAAADGLLAEDSHPVMIERQVPGEIFRMMVARGKVRCVVRRDVPHVTGDGRRTVRELTAARNRETAEARSKADYLGEIPFDEECEAELRRQGVELDDVIEKGRRIPLRRIPLLSTGAVYTDVTDETHPDTCRMAEMITAALALVICGIDFVSRDISRSFAEEGAVLEVNTTPGLRVPLMAGFDAKEIGRMIMGDRPGRIPATLLVAPEDRPEGLPGALHFDDATGWVVGADCGLGSLQFPSAPNAATPPSEASAHQLALQIVRNPLVSRIFIATALDEIVRSGLPLDRFDKIVCVDCEPAQVWETVLRNAADVYLEGMELDDALRECGIEAPQPVAAS